MDSTWAKGLATWAAMLVPFVVRAAEPSSVAAPIVPNAPASLPTAAEGASERSGSPAAKEGKAPAPEPKGGVVPTDPKAKAAKVQATERLRTLETATGTDAPGSGKALRAILNERLHWLDEWDKAEAARHAAEHPEPNPERQTAEWKADLERIKTMLDQSAKDPEALLPSAFRDRNPGAAPSETARAEMKDALDSAKSELKDWTTRLEKRRAESASTSNTSSSTLRADRDKIFQRVATLKARAAERAAAVESAKTPEEADLARDRLVNFDWESRVENQRLQTQETLLALEAKQADLAVLNLQVLEARALLATKTLERMQARYRTVTDRQEHTLQQAAANEQKRAKMSDDPLERFRARHSAELLELEAQVLKDENALASSPYPTLEGQKRQADRADADFAGVKHLLDDGRVSHLDALRLNNDFRRIGPERARIVARERAAAAAQLAFYENALSHVELDLINDSRIERLELETLLEQLPQPRHAEAIAQYHELETRHTVLLEKRRLALEQLAGRAEQTHEQIERRIRTLDDQFGFIRTHIFWVRDQDGIGAATLWQAQREMMLAGKALAKLALELGDPGLWGRVSVEFIVGLVALALAPWPLLRVRRMLAERTRRADPPPVAAPGQNGVGNLEFEGS